MKISIQTGKGAGAFEKHLPLQEDRIRSLIKSGFRVFDYTFILIYQEKTLLGDEWQEYLRPTKELLKECNAECFQAHVCGGGPRFEDFLKDEHTIDIFLNSVLKRVMECCQYLNIPYLVFHPGMIQGNTREEFLENNRRYFKKILPLAETTGTEILIENVGIPGTPYLVGSGAELADLVDYIAHPLVGACWDTGHANHHSKYHSQYDSILALGKRLKAIHVHDNFGCHAGMDQSHWWRDFHTMPFIGTISFDEIMSGLIDIGYTGTFNLETVLYRDFTTQKAFHKNGVKIDKLSIPSLEIIEESNRLQYNVAKEILSQYDCYEY